MGLLFDRRRLSSDAVGMDKRDQLREAGRWLHEERERKGVTVRELAARADVSTQVVYDWQNGKLAVTHERAEVIATTLGLDLIETCRRLGLWLPPGLNGRSAELDSDEAFDKAADELERRYRDEIIPGFDRIIADPEKRRRLRRILADAEKRRRLEFALQLIDDDSGDEPQEQSG